jgi:hypothetical protein
MPGLLLPSFIARAEPGTVDKRAKCGRLDMKTMFTIRAWERYQFLMDYEHFQVLEEKSMLPYPIEANVLIAC